jgi:hypothetical protein
MRRRLRCRQPAAAAARIGAAGAESPRNTRPARRPAGPPAIAAARPTSRPRRCPIPTGLHWAWAAGPPGPGPHVGPGQGKYICARSSLAGGAPVGCRPGALRWRRAPLSARAPLFRRGGAGAGSAGIRSAAVKSRDQGPGLWAGSSCWLSAGVAAAQAAPGGRSPPRVPRPMQRSRTGRAPCCTCLRGRFRGGCRGVLASSVS